MTLRVSMKESDFQRVGKTTQKPFGSTVNLINKVTTGFSTETSLFTKFKKDISEQIFLCHSTDYSR